MKKTHLIVLLLTIILPLQVYGKVYAVLVGISQYEESINNLTYCNRDAIVMYEMLKEYTTPDKMILLTNRQAKRDVIVSKTQQLFKQAMPEDVVIFFFSGHGSKNVFYTHDKGLNFNTLKNIFKQTKAKRKLIFADACFAGTLRKSGNQGASENHNLGDNILLFLSSRSNQNSRENYSLKNGTFTYFLVAGLKGGADINGDNYITAKELYDFVYPKVKDRTKGMQTPVMWGRFDKNLIILKLNKK